MGTVIPHSELLQRALAVLTEEMAAYPSKTLEEMLDDVAMRFNLSPLESDSLCRILKSSRSDNTTND